eukprot:Lankesteria_metandrocarpae@DN4564_c0_g1_i1.p2
MVDDKEKGEQAQKSVWLTMHPSDVLLPDPTIVELQHQLQLPNPLSNDSNREKAKNQLLVKIEENCMIAYYRRLANTLGWIEDEALVQKLEKQRDETLEALGVAIEDAETNLGETEVRDAFLRQAHFYCRIGDKENALQWYSKTYDKSVGAGNRLDVIDTLVRVGLCEGDLDLSRDMIELAKKELDRGGDWERRNKLKVYEAVMLMTVRSLKEAAELFLGAVATFTATELLTFEALIFYTVVIGMMTLERPVIKEKLINNSDILQVLGNDSDLKQFLFSYYRCDYSTFMQQLVRIAGRVRVDRYLGPHYAYFVRNIRLRAYKQFLAPYKSVTLTSMSVAFALPASFIEEDVASFIASSRLSSRIDKVNGVIESDLADEKDTVYNQILKEGDQLLNRLQKLSRVIDI